MARAVDLQSHDPAWAEWAHAEAATLRGLLGENLVAIHHIGSTAVSGMRAKPVIDLLLVVSAIAALDPHRAAIEAAGYRWRGENGLAGRRYFTRDDVRSDARRVQAHGYAVGAPAIARHLAFRDALRTDPALAADYDAEKARCRDRYPDDTGAYARCKAGWIVAAIDRLADAGVPAPHTPTG